MDLYKKIILAALITVSGASWAFSDEPIDRKALVSRHHIVDPPAQTVLPLGNGEFCFGVDATGLQTFDGNSYSHWGKHSEPLPPGVTAQDIPETGTFDRGPVKGLMLTPERESAVYKWMASNPHPLNLGRFRFIDTNGEALTEKMISNSKRTLDLWEGVQTASFIYEGSQVTVETLVLPDRDGIAVRIHSELLGEGKLGIQLDFPMPLVRNSAVNCKIHKTDMHVAENRLSFDRQMDSDRYTGTWRVMKGSASFKANQDANRACLLPDNGDALEFVCEFSQSKPDAESYTDFNAIKAQTAVSWKKFWMSGGAVDFSGSRDPRWKELERRVVLSQYLMRTNNAGSIPPGEYALLKYAGWIGQFHMEMVWWHMAHYGLWDRWDLADEALTIYQRFLPIARKRATQLDYRGAKWGKQNSPDGRMRPWDGNLGLSWQQAHPIFFAEQEYRLNPGKETLLKWEEVVFATAEYMASFPVKDEQGVYHLNYVRTANENGICHDPSFELAYWRWGLEKAQEWRVRLGMKPDESWQKVLANLAPLKLEKVSETGDEVYGWCAEWEEMLMNRLNSGHPDPIGAFAFIPFVEGVDQGVASNTISHIKNTWNWEKCWGWDFPWGAMAAARTGQPEMAIELLLMDVSRNQYCLRGINGNGYFPGNGGVLYAVAMMAAGWDGCPEHHAPGFPDNGQWMVRWEGLKPAL